jgi:predicted esterase
VSLWCVALVRNRRAVARFSGSGDPSHGIVVFVEPVRWLFIVWGFVSVAKGLRRGHCKNHLRLFRWSGRAGALLVVPDMVRRKRLLRKARRLARFVEELAAQHPGCKIHLVGYSSGCYLATEAVKRVNTPQTLGMLILLSSTVSPGYRLDKVANRVQRLDSFHSPADFIISGLGPLLFGCNDSRRAPAAGMVGFRSAPHGATQHAWSPNDVRLGYFGDHFSITASRFISAQVAPILAKTPTAPLDLASH